MPASTDRPPVASQRASAPPRVWPATAGIVLLGLLLLAWDVFAAGINTAPFFGDTPSRDRYIESGMVLVTALVPVMLLCALGLALRSRLGLLFLLVPAGVAAVAGLDLLGRTGDPDDADPNRAVTAADTFQDLTRPNWLAAGLVLATLGLVFWRRRRQTGTRADPEQAQGAT